MQSMLEKLIMTLKDSNDQQEINNTARLLAASGILKPSKTNNKDKDNKSKDKEE